MLGRGKGREAVGELLDGKRRIRRVESEMVLSDKTAELVRKTSMVYDPPVISNDIKSKLPDSDPPPPPFSTLNPDSDNRV